MLSRRGKIERWETTANVGIFWKCQFLTSSPPQPLLAVFCEDGMPFVSFILLYLFLSVSRSKTLSFPLFSDEAHPLPHKPVNSLQTGFKFNCSLCKMDLSNHLESVPAGPAEARKISIHHMCAKHKITIIRDGKGWAADVQEGQRKIVTMFSLGRPRFLNTTQNEQTTHASSRKGLHDTIRRILGIFVQCHGT